MPKTVLLVRPDHISIRLFPSKRDFLNDPAAAVAQQSIMQALTHAHYTWTVQGSIKCRENDLTHPPCPENAAIAPDHQSWRVVSFVWLGIFVIVGLKISHDLYRKRCEDRRTRERRAEEAQAWLDYTAMLREPPPQYTDGSKQSRPPAYEHPPSYGTFGNEAMSSSRTDQDMC